QGAWHLDDLGDGRITADRNRDLRGLCSRALYGAPDGLADRFGIDNGLLVDGILGCRLSRVRFDPVLTASHGQLDQFYRRSGYVKSQKRAILALQEEHYSFLFRTLRPKMTAPSQFWNNYISVQS